MCMCICMCAHIHMHGESQSFDDITLNLSNEYRYKFIRSSFILQPSKNVLPCFTLKLISFKRTESIFVEIVF